MVSIILTSLSCNLLISLAVARRIRLMSGSLFHVDKPRIGAIDFPNQDSGASPDTADEITFAAASDVPTPIASGISGNARLLL